MPGINVAWQYDTKITAEAKFSNDLLNGYIYTEFVRFVNIIDLFQEDQKIIWKIIKESRLTDLYQFEKTKPECNYHNTLFSNEIIKKNNDFIESKLGIKANTKTMENITKETIQSAGEMFTYLNLCSDVLVLYKDILKSSPTDIILGLKSIIETSSNSEKQNAEKIWKFVMKTLNLDFHSKLEYYFISKNYPPLKMMNNKSDVWKIELPLKGQ